MKEEIGINLQEYLHTPCGDIFISSYTEDSYTNVFLIVPGLGWHLAGPNRSNIQLAEYCNLHEIATVLFDYPGSGESAGLYSEQTIESLSFAFLAVYEYTMSRYNGNIFLLGFGIGNILIALNKERLKHHKIVYYLPEFDFYKCLPKPWDDFVIDGIIDYGEDQSPQERYLFYKAVFGALHDVTYNPVSYTIVNDLEKMRHFHFKKCIDTEDALIISDSEENGAYIKAEYWYINEFNTNKFPGDWYTTINLWPRVLEKLHMDITKWLHKQICCKNQDESDEKCKINVSSISINERIRRELIPFSSSGEDLYGVLHDNGVSSKKTCVVFVPGVGGSKVDSYICGPRFGDFLANRGMYFYRHDCRNEGTHISSLAGLNWTDIINDTLEALKQLSSKTECEQFYFVAWSAGIKTICALSQIIPQKIKGCCLWNPIFSDKPQKRETPEFVMPKYIKNTHGVLVTQYGGDFLGLNYVVDGRKYDFVDMYKNMESIVKIIWGSPDSGGEDYTIINSINKHEHSETIHTRHHLFSYSDMDDLFEKTYQWIERKEV